MTAQNIITLFVSKSNFKVQVFRYNRMLHACHAIFIFMYSLLINHGLGLGVIDCCSMCHLWRESRHRWWLWARWYGDHCLVSTLTLPRHPRVPMGHTAASPRPRVSSVSSLLTLTPDSIRTILCPMSVQSRQSRLELITAMQPPARRGEKLIGGFIYLALARLYAVFLHLSHSWATIDSDLLYWKLAASHYIMYILWLTKHLFLLAGCFSLSSFPYISNQDVFEVEGFSLDSEDHKYYWRNAGHRKAHTGPCHELKQDFLKLETLSIYISIMYCCSVYFQRFHLPFP